MLLAIEACKKFHYESGKSKADQKITIGLKCLQTIPRRVTFLHDNQINLNIHKNVFRNLYVDPTLETWFPNKYIEAEIKKKLEKTRVQLASDEMENEIRHYIDSINHDPHWVRIITNDINKLLVNREYIDFFMQIYMQWISDNSYTSSDQIIIIECLPHFERLDFYYSRYILKLINDSLLCVQ